jgi:hypothetical protein
MMQAVKNSRRGVLAAVAVEAPTTVSTTHSTTVSATVGAFASLIDTQGTTINLLAVECRLGLCRVSFVHLDEAEAARPVSFAVHDEFGTDNRTVLGEEFPELGFRGVEGQVADEEFLGHGQNHLALTLRLYSLQNRAQHFLFLRHE